MIIITICNLRDIPLRYWIIKCFIPLRSVLLVYFWQVSWNRSPAAHTGRWNILRRNAKTILSRTLAISSTHWLSPHTNKWTPAPRITTSPTYVSTHSTHVRLLMRRAKMKIWTNKYFYYEVRCLSTVGTVSLNPLPNQTCTTNINSAWLC